MAQATGVARPAHRPRGVRRGSLPFEPDTTPSKLARRPSAAALRVQAPKGPAPSGLVSLGGAGRRGSYKSDEELASSLATQASAMQVHRAAWTRLTIRTGRG